ncbi:MAG: alpha/beta hydrolase [Rhodospirillaceae bacterium]|nr:alpha/beta hydrolase [Rhodospirillaceae bacterium]MBT6137578.1 alpha/beta hydrolase [Rhodospirillaceae bacterium]
MRTLDIKGSTIAYGEDGTGETLILVHGSAGSGSQWRDLRNHLPGSYRVLTPDLYGYGLSDSWSDGGRLRLTDEAAPIAQLIEQADGPVHLVGHSYGGAVALRLAHECPDKIQSLTVIEPVAFQLLAQGGPRERALHQEIMEVAKALSRATLVGDYQDGMRTFIDYWNGAGAWARLHDHIRRDLCRRASKVILDFAATFSERTTREDLARIQIPTLVLRGTRTPGPARQVADMVATTIPGAEMQIIDGAGHMSPLSHSRQIAAAISEHLSLGETDRLLRRALTRRPANAELQAAQAS